MLHEGNEVQGKYGKQAWLIVRRFIAVAMDQGGSTKIAYKDVGGRATQEQLAEAARFFLNSFRYKLYLSNDTKLTSN
jgi:hypothetical protein